MAKQVKTGNMLIPSSLVEDITPIQYGVKLMKGAYDMADNVNHPKHYEGSTSLECIEVMQIAYGTFVVYDFCICNAFKYLWRYGNKNGEEDLNKAEWYINKAQELTNFDDDSTVETLRETLRKHKERFNK